MRRFIKNLLTKIIMLMNQRFKTKVLNFAVYIRNIIISEENTFSCAIHERMSVDNFLPKRECEESVGEKMETLLLPTTKKRIRIVYPSGTSWSCIGTLYDALKADDRYQVYIITENYPNYIKVMVDKKCDYITLDNYDITQDKPDVLLLTSYSYTDPKFRLKDIHNHAKKVIALFPNVVINESDMKMHWDWVKNAYGVIKPDYYLFDALPHKFSKGYIDQDKAIKIGCPIYDELYEKLECTHEENKHYSKLKGKKTFLWATDHGINETHPIDAISIDLYIKDFFDYFSKHTEYGLIIRLHPFLKRELLQSGIFWSESDFERLKQYCDNSPNIVWDEVPDYSYAFMASDALLVDVNCGFVFSYLPTGKPICRLMRNDMEVKLIHPEYKDAYYYATNFSECEEFISDVALGKDEKDVLRKQVFEEAILNYDGKNGSRIKAFIDELAF